MSNEMSTASLFAEMRKAGGELFTHETITHAGGVWHPEIADGQYVFPEETNPAFPSVGRIAERWRRSERRWIGGEHSEFFRGPLAHRRSGQRHSYHPSRGVRPAKSQDAVHVGPE